jgi:hypothetical protein
MTLRTQRGIILLVLAVFAYGGAYLLFRTLHMHRNADGESLTFLIPEKQRPLYYAFAPLIYLDGAATGIRCEIAP